MTRVRCRERRRRIAQDVAAGMTTSEVAAKHGVSLRVVYLACRANHVAAPRFRGRA